MPIIQPIQRYQFNTKHLNLKDESKAPFTLHVGPGKLPEIAGVPSVWTQTRPGINSGIDPGLGT